jgi:hypothetical protein
VFAHKLHIPQWWPNFPHPHQYLGCYSQNQNQTSQHTGKHQQSFLVLQPCMTHQTNQESITSIQDFPGLPCTHYGKLPSYFPQSCFSLSFIFRADLESSQCKLFKFPFFSLAAVSEQIVFLHCCVKSKTSCTPFCFFSLSGYVTCYYWSPKNTS